LRAGRRFYRMVGESLSVVGLGTWAIRDYEKAFNVIVKGVKDYGVNVIDTAEMYGYGASERLVGRVIAEAGRDSVFVVTKLLPERFQSRETAVKAARRSMERLGVREADLVLIHWPSATTSIEEQVRNLEAIADAGLARFVGVSNFDAAELREALEAARRYEIVADQIHYSPIARQAEAELIPLAESVGVMVQAYRVIERGTIGSYASEEAARRLGLTPVQAAIAYVVARTPVSLALVKTESVGHLEEIVEASRIALSAGLDVELLGRVFKR